jgi:hypothetical protein
MPLAIFAVRRKDVRFEQRVNNKFCVKLGKTAMKLYFGREWHRLKGRRHENIEVIQAAAKMLLTDIPKEAFISCFQDVLKRWLQCIDCGGNYFEGDRKHYL